jgi:hypothetical protein
MQNCCGIVSAVFRIVCIAGSIYTTGVVMANTANPASTAATVVEITRQGRKIMHDGFLMEWSMQTARTWGSGSSWLWDAMATPEGLAGYLRMQSSPACSGWVITFTDVKQNHRYEVRLPMDTAYAWHNEVIKIDQTGDDSSRIYTLEWLFPWHRELSDTTTPFSLRMEGRCINGDTLSVVTMECLYNGKKPAETNGLIGRIVIIGLLAVMYLMVQRKVRNQTRQRESPHQST